MPLQIRLPHKLLIAVLEWTRKWILSTGIMSLHVGFEVVATTEQLVTSFDVALEVCILLGSESSLHTFGARQLSGAAPLVLGRGQEPILAR